MDDLCVDDTRPGDHQRTDACIGQLLVTVLERKIMGIHSSLVVLLESLSCRLDFDTIYP